MIRSFRTLASPHDSWSEAMCPVVADLRRERWLFWLSNLLEKHVPLFLYFGWTGPAVFQDWSLQCPSNVIWPFKIYASFSTTTLQNATPSWNMKTSLESPWYNLPTTRIDMRRALSLQEVELHDWLALDFFSHCTATHILVHDSCPSLLAMSIGHRLCVNFYVSRVNFLTTLCSHLNVTCSYYFWSSLINVDDESLHTLDK